MNTIRYLTDPMLADLYWPAVATGLALAAVGGVLSVLVVLRRLAFIGQGVSHAAFGGVGVAAMLGLAGAAATPTHAALSFVVVFAFCLGAALLIGRMTERGSTQADTAIGIVLVASMALGAVLIHISASGVEWESFLFGSIVGVQWVDAAIAWGVAGVVLAALWWRRRPLVFWAFDPGVARAMGVSERAMTLMLMTLLALVTVTAMKLAGVVLATAMLVLPGAAALRLSSRWGTVLALSCAVAAVGVLGGLVVSFELDWPTGPAIVGVLTVAYAAALLRRR